MSDIVIRGALGIFTGLSGCKERASGDIRVRGKKIVAIGEIAPEPGDQILDASGCVITPGLISTHHHLFQSVLKGIPTGIDASFHEWLQNVPFTYWHRLDEEALSVAAETGMVELLLSGCTTVADHHYLLPAPYGFDQAAIWFETASRLGIRMVLARGCQTTSRAIEIPGAFAIPPETLDVLLKRTEELVHAYNDPSPAAERRVVLAPTTPLWSVRPEELSEIAAAGRQMGVNLHSHLSESSGDVDLTLSKFGQRPIQYMGDQGWLGPDVWFAHLICVDDSEIRLLAETRTGMAHCPQCNARIGTGIAPADKIDGMGGRVSLAVDGSAANEAGDMAAEMHAAWLLHRSLKGPGSVRCEDVMRWATSGGADVLGLPAIGRIAPGYAADIAIFDLTHPRYAGLHDPLIAPVASGGGAQLRHVMMGGRPVVVNGAVPGVDIAALSARARAVVRRLANA